MKKKSRVFSVLLALCMLLAFTPVVSLAAPVNDYYAVYNSYDETLTFCYGELDGTTVYRDAGGKVEGTDVYSDFLEYNYPWSEHAGDIQVVIFLDEIYPLTTTCWFDDFSNLTEIVGLEKLHTEQITDMEAMFEGCSSLTELDVSNWYTGNVTQMDDLFAGCSALTELDVSNWEVKNVTEMDGIFTGCSSLTELNVSNWDTSKVLGMAAVFAGCTGITSLDLSSWSTEKVEWISYMFIGCSALSSLTLGKNFRFTEDINYEDNESTFADLPDVPENDSYTGKWVLQGSDEYHLTSAELMETYNGSDSMIGTWVWETTGSVAPTEETYIVYKDGTVTFCVGTLTENGVERKNGEIVSGTNYAIANSNLELEKELNTDYIAKIVFLDEVTDLSTKCMLEGLDQLVEITGLEKLHTENCYSMECMFGGCSSLTSLDLSSFNTGSLEYSYYMFEDCTNLTSLDLSSFDTRNVTDMDSMFAGCTALSSLTLGQNFCFKVYYDQYEDEYYDAGLPAVPENAFYTGKWVLQGSDEYRLTSAELMETYDGATMAGTWVWETTGAPFLIDIAGATVTAADRAYTGSPVTTTVTVVLDGVTLRENEDYTLTYANNTDVGTAQVTVTGIGAYTGSKTVSFNIRGNSGIGGNLSTAGEIIRAVHTDEGDGNTGTYEVFCNGNVLVNGTDYTLSIFEYIEQNKVIVTATGIGAYCGSVSGTFNFKSNSCSCGSSDCTCEHGHTGNSQDSGTTDESDPGSKTLSFLEFIKQLFQKLVAFIKSFC